MGASPPNRGPRSPDTHSPVVSPRSACGSPLYVHAVHTSARARPRRRDALWQRAAPQRAARAHARAPCPAVCSTRARALARAHRKPLPPVRPRRARPPSHRACQPPQRRARALALARAHEPPCEGMPGARLPPPPCAATRQGPAAMRMRPHSIRDPARCRPRLHRGARRPTPRHRHPPPLPRGRHGASAPLVVLSRGLLRPPSGRAAEPPAATLPPHAHPCPLPLARPLPSTCRGRASLAAAGVLRGPRPSPPPA